MKNETAIRIQKQMNSTIEKEVKIARKLMKF